MVLISINKTIMIDERGPVIKRSPEQSTQPVDRVRRAIAMLPIFAAGGLLGFGAGRATSPETIQGVESVDDSEDLVNPFENKRIFVQKEKEGILADVESFKTKLPSSVEFNFSDVTGGLEITHDKSTKKFDVDTTYERVTVDMGTAGDRAVLLFTYQGAVPGRQISIDSKGTVSYSDAPIHIGSEYTPPQP
jgi:hypothetical protein